MDVTKYLLTSDDGKKPESIEQILNDLSAIHMITEDNDNYYVIKNHEDPYDHLMWVIDKKTGKTGWMDSMDFLINGIYEQSKIVEPPYTNLKIG